MKDLMAKIKNYFAEDFGFTFRRYFPKYKTIPLYKGRAWTMMKDRVFKGYDESITWGLYYHLAKYILPRLTMFYDKMDDGKAIPYDYEKYYIDKYIKMGNTFYYSHHRFKDKEINKKVFEAAYDHWKTDIFKMMEAFRDIINEEDNYDRWHQEHQASVDLVKSVLASLRTFKERKKYWDSFNFGTEYKDGILLNAYMFADKKRKEGLRLFSEHFLSLWW